ncbi:MAG TPA: DUF5709 domain-containing protein [Mycobacteriales bacterium]|nr:DUF5709 domain-containing protein [Mycobacteriales bacterium]
MSAVSGYPEPDPGSALEDEGIPDQSDALPGKVITGDAQEDLPVPRDYPIAVTDFGMTAEEERAGESLEGRLDRELPDVDAAAGRGDGDGQPYPEDPDERAGRLAELPSETGDGQDMWAENVGADSGGFAPEERAMHVDDS